MEEFGQETKCQLVLLLTVIIFLNSVFIFTEHLIIWFITIQFTKLKPWMWIRKLIRIDYIFIHRFVGRIDIMSIELHLMDRVH